MADPQRYALMLGVGGRHTLVASQLRVHSSIPTTNETYDQEALLETFLYAV